MCIGNDPASPQGHGGTTPAGSGRGAFSKDRNLNVAGARMTDGGYTAEEAARLQTFKYKDGEGPYRVITHVPDKMYSVAGPTDTYGYINSELGALIKADELNRARAAGWTACLVDYLDAPHATEGRKSRSNRKVSAGKSPRAQRKTKPLARRHPWERA